MDVFQSLPSSIVAYHITPFIESPNDLLALRRTSKWMNKILHESDEAEDIWKHFLERDFHLSVDDNINDNDDDDDPNPTHYLKTLKISPQQPQQQGHAYAQEAVSIFGYSASESVMVTNTSFESWKHWIKAKRRYYNGCDTIDEKKMNAPYFLRAANLWSQIESWCQRPKNTIVGHRIMNTLISGTTYGGGRFADNDQPGTHAFRAIFSFYDGQHDGRTPAYYPSDVDFLCGGLFGGYVVYEDAVCMRLMPSSFHESQQGRPSRVGIAFNGFSQRANRFIHVDCNDGQVYVAESLVADEHVDPSIPMSRSSANDKYDAGLVWMEDFAGKLAREEIGMGKISPYEGGLAQAILHYPTVQCQHQYSSGDNPLPIVSRTVTKGVEVIASSHFDPLVKQYISYSIRLRLLTNEDEEYMTPSERGFETCQLMSRHWVLLDGETGREDIVDGDGIIGFYPVLMEGVHRIDSGRSMSNTTHGVVSEGSFRYQSCASTTSKSFRGRIRFIPGSLESPTGRPFFVNLAPFALVSNAQIAF